jgi:hypothetical protein
LAAQPILAQGLDTPSARGREESNEEWPMAAKHDTGDKGKHIIHSGGKYDSYLQIPEIPPKYQAGDYIYH